METCYTEVAGVSWLYHHLNQIKASTQDRVRAYKNESNYVPSLKEQSLIRITNNDEIKAQLKEKILQNVYIHPTTNCWIWLKGCNKSGYGIIAAPNEGTLATHRVSYTVFLVLFFMCDDRKIV